MYGLTLLDVLLLLWLLGQFIYGLRVGLLVSLGGVLGFAAGAVAAFFAVPFVSAAVSDSSWRTAVVVVTALVLVIIGHGLGIRAGASLGRNLKLGPARVVGRVLGGAVSLAVAALMLSLLAFSVSNLGIPVLSAQLSQSRLITTIDRWTPTPVKAAVAQLRSAVLSEGIPQLFDLPGPAPSSAPPNTSTDTPALNTAAAAVLKITGTAFQCGQNQTGSGFVIAEDRVITNAHVVAGVTQPVVETPDGGALEGRVVSFDPDRDLAVLAVDGLGITPLPIGEELEGGDAAVVAGYPHGGPYTTKPATVQTVTQMLVPDIYGQDPGPEEIYQLNADVQPGNSGGPVLNEQGQVVGVVFAKATTDAPVGFALTLDELGPVAGAAPGLDARVSSGTCVRK
ncbi:MAG: peptidase and chymotrypsin/Hap [Micrococcaceae bacterium]|nr:peptidase and chymotrypsin/Hap [Micrococcaceae bacterium]